MKKCMQHLGVRLLEISARNLLVELEAIEREMPLQPSMEHLSNPIAKSILPAIM